MIVDEISEGKGRVAIVPNPEYQKKDNKTDRINAIT
jgi:hypothetical protein